MIKSCGGCRHWVKWSEDGLCNLNDWRYASDHVCSGWKGKKYSKLDRRFENEEHFRDE